jgi:hypothetical protein
MPYLFCQKDGKERSQAFQKQSLEAFEGEGIVLTKGRLISGNWACDVCNGQLKKGDNAYFMSIIIPDRVEEFDSYDFKYEREYFDVKEENIELYGFEGQIDYINLQNNLMLSE